MSHCECCMGKCGGRCGVVGLFILPVIILLIFLSGCSHVHRNCAWVNQCNEIYAGKPEFNCGECGETDWWWQ